MKLDFIVLANQYSIYKFAKDAVLPDWIYRSDFYSITKTLDEQSVVATQTDIATEDVSVSRDWRILKITGILDFSLVGIIAYIAAILRERGVSIFTISTYDTDYILVKHEDLYSSTEALRAKGNTVSIEN